MDHFIYSFILGPLCVNSYFSFCDNSQEKYVHKYPQPPSEHRSNKSLQRKLNIAIVRFQELGSFCFREV